MGPKREKENRSRLEPFFPTTCFSLPPFIQKEFVAISTSTMQSLPLLHNSYLHPFRTGALISTTAAAASYFIQFQVNTRQNFRGKPLIGAAISGNSGVDCDYPSIVLDSLRVLQWDQLCDCVASFAGTTMGKQATKVYK